MYNDIRKNENKGFSLVELIVVIAIMAVMTAVLAPALLQYVEKSRAQKDDSAMGEVVNVVKLALADQNVYDELLCYTATTNASHYTDEEDEVRGELCACENAADHDTKGTDTATTDAANFRGVTVTFSRYIPATGVQGNNDNKFVLADGVINAGKPSSATLFNGTAPVADAKLGTMHSGNGTTELYNKVKAGIENGEVKLTSQTYRNSNYTIFIKMGGSDEAVVVYGEWDGTNLHTA